MTARRDDDGGGLGGRIGGRLANVVADASLYAKERATSHTNRVAQQVLTDFTNHVSDEIRSVLGGLWSKLAGDESTPDELRPVFHALATERGQAWAWIGGAVTSSGLAAGLAGVFEAYLADFNHAVNRALRPAILSPSDAARANAIDRTGGIDIWRELSGHGFSDDRIGALLALARATLAPEVILDLLRRRRIGREDARALLRRAGYEDADITRLLALQWLPLSPPDAAAGWARSELSEAQSDEIGAQSGATAEDMRVLRALAGMPPSPDELLLAWRRGIIDEAAVTRGIVQGPIRNEWIPVIKSLQWQPMPVSEAADAVNQNHMSAEAARKVARENGFRDEVFDVFVANAGIPPGPQETLDWVNRGLLTEAEGLQALYESRIKNKWVPKYMESRHELMPPETIRLMYSRGALSKEDAISRLMRRGYSADDAAIIVNGASAEKTAPTRDLTVSQVLALRAEGLVSTEDSLALLQAAGYDAEEALWVTELADLRRVSRFVTAAINRTKASYVAGRLSEVDAGTVLDGLGLPADYKDQAFALWDLERQTVTKGLTPTQVVNAVKANLIDASQGVDRLMGQGYAREDAVILLILGKAVSGPSEQEAGS